MTRYRRRDGNKRNTAPTKGRSTTSPLAMGVVALAVIAVLALLLWVNPTARDDATGPSHSQTQESIGKLPRTDTWIERAFAVTRLFHQVYTPCWEGAYGALGDAYLFALTGDSSLLRFHTQDHDLRNMCVGTWVDDRAWV